MAIGVSPARIIIENAQKGSLIQKEVLISDVESGATVDITLEDNAKDLLDIQKTHTFPKDDNSLTIPFVIKIPDDLPNGLHQTKIRISTSSEKRDSLGPSISAESGVYVNLFLNITGEQIIDYKITQMLLHKVQESQPIPIEIFITNNGNIIALPKRVTIDIIDARTSAFVSSSESVPKIGVAPYTKGSIPMIFDLALGVGSYFATITVYDEKEQIYQTKLSLTVLNKDSLHEYGILQNLLFKPKILLGDTQIISAQFKNTGSKTTSAYMQVNIYKQDKLLTTLTTNEHIIHPNNAHEFSVEYTPEEEGFYLANAKIYYSNTSTIEHKNVFKVMSKEQAQDEIFDLSKYTQGINTTLLVLILIALMLLLFKKKKYDPQ